MSRLDELPSALIGECGSFLSAIQYFALGQTSRKVYLSLLSPPRIHTFNAELFAKKPQCLSMKVFRNVRKLCTRVVDDWGYSKQELDMIRAFQHQLETLHCSGHAGEANFDFPKLRRLKLDVPSVEFILSLGEQGKLMLEYAHLQNNDEEECVRSFIDVMICKQLSLQHLVIEVEAHGHSRLANWELFGGAVKHLETTLLSAKHRDSKSLLIELRTYMLSGEDDSDAEAAHWERLTSTNMIGLVDALNATDVVSWTLKIRTRDFKVLESASSAEVARMEAVWATHGCSSSFTWDESEFREMCLCTRYPKLIDSSQRNGYKFLWEIVTVANTRTTSCNYFSRKLVTISLCVSTWTDPF